MFRRHSTFARAGGAILIAAAALAPAATAAAPPPQSGNCPANAHPGKLLTSTPWPQLQLNFQDVWPLTEGRYVSSGRFHGQDLRAGDPVPVAVIDSGLTPFDETGRRANPIFRGADLARQVDVVPGRYPDCVGHGTEVASLIVAQQGGSSLLAGVSPQVHLVPIRYTDTDSTADDTSLATALADAIALHVRVINLSVEMVNRPTGRLLALLTDARNAGIVIVAAGGNDSSQGSGPYYPAALSPTFDDIIAVSAVDRNGAAANFGVTGKYVDVAAPGVDVPVALRLGGVVNEQGTSFATPFVTGTVALMLAAHPEMTPAQVKQRLEVTADPPPGDVPNSTYGYGFINPVQAVTSVEDDSAALPSISAGKPIAVARPSSGPDRTLQHRALAIAVVLLGLAAIAVTAAAILRGNRRARPRA